MREAAGAAAGARDSQAGAAPATRGGSAKPLSSTFQHLHTGSLLSPCILRGGGGEMHTQDPWRARHQAGGDDGGTPHPTAPRPCG